MRTRRLIEGAVAYCCAGGILLLISAQLTPGWSTAAQQPLVQPQPDLPPSRDSLVSVTQSPVEVEVGSAEPLSAWIVRPRRDHTEGLVPGVVIVPGSGAKSRDAMLPEARALAASGVAAIVYDKRVRGYSSRQRDFLQLADDAVRAADVLTAQPGVDPRRVGVLGFSEGGWVGPSAAARAPERFAFVVLVSAPVVTPLQQSIWIVDHRLAGWPGWLRRVPATSLATGRSWVNYLDFDVRPALQSLRVPVYAVWGADDPIVPVDVAVQEVQRAVPGPVTVLILAGSGHRPAPESGWSAAAARWIAQPAADGSVSGSEPASSAGVPGVPHTSLLANVAAPVLLSVGTALIVVFRRRPRDRHHREVIALS